MLRRNLNFLKPTKVQVVQKPTCSRPEGRTAGESDSATAGENASCRHCLQAHTFRHVNLQLTGSILTEVQNS